ncbi:hypothetical protein A2U01_0118501, partial [Trifolium medium]|nr:hypothetical protein [Trifolium medium]
VIGVARRAVLFRAFWLLVPALRGAQAWLRGLTFVDF